MNSVRAARGERGSAVVWVLGVFAALVAIVILLLIIFGGGLRELAGWMFLGFFLLGGVLWAVVGNGTDGGARAWGDLGRSLLIGGLMAFAVWAVAELRRPIEDHHNLKLSLGVQQAMPGIDLHGEDLSEFDLAGKNLSDADLSSANLTGATLVGANLSGADLSGADLAQAKLEEANLAGANLERAQLDEAVANLVDLRRARLLEANLTGAQLSGAEMQGACLSDAILANASLPDAQLQNADLTAADLSHTQFWYDLRGADLSSAGLRGAQHAQTARWPPELHDRYLDLVHPGDRAPQPRPPDPALSQLRAGSVRRVVDGDTLTVQPSSGSPALYVRLIGIDAPDLTESRGVEAQAALRRLLPEGRRVRYQYDDDEKAEDKFGRRLLYVFAPGGGLVNQLMLERGMAVAAIDSPGKGRRETLYAPELIAGEAWARKHAEGMWLTCPP